MPTPFDPQLTLYTQVWAMLEASPAFLEAFPKPALRIKSTVPKAGQRDEELRAPADAAKIKIDVAEEIDNDRAPKVFGQNSTTFTAAVVDYKVPLRLALTIKIVHESTKLQDQTPKEAAVRGALLARGRTLGLAWVTDSILRGTKRREETSPDTNNQRRTISLMRLEVTARPKLSQLTAGSLPTP